MELEELETFEQHLNEYLEEEYEGHYSLDLETGEGDVIGVNIGFSEGSDVPWVASEVYEVAEYIGWDSVEVAGDMNAGEGYYTMDVVGS